MSEPPDIHLRRAADELSAQPQGTVSIVALGDLMLSGEWDDLGARDAVADALGELTPLCENDLVIANLEVTCQGSEGTIAKEPRVIGQPRTLQQALRALRVDIANLANNHTFDALRSGYEEVRRILEQGRIRFLGAGETLAAASRPLFFERDGLRFGFLSYTALDTRPSHVASADGYGVNPLEAARALEEAASWSQNVDHLIISLHWGVEYCHLPSPDQIRLARALIDRGARLVIGHHAHVVQGVEAWNDGAILYNLGNAVTTDLEIDGRPAIRATPSARSSFLARATFGKTRLENVELLPFYAGPGHVTVGDAAARTLLERANAELARGVTDARWRRVRLYEDVILRTLRKLHPRVIGSVRPRHVAKVFLNLWRAARGRGPA